MWTAVFTVALVAFVCLSAAALLAGAEPARDHGGQSGTQRAQAGAR